MINLGFVLSALLAPRPEPEEVRICSVAQGWDPTKVPPPHQTRVIDERDQLATRLTALQTLIKSGNVDNRLLRQELIMVDYLAVLNERIAAW